MLLPKNKDRYCMEVVLEDGLVLNRKKRTELPYKHEDSERIQRILDPYNVQVSFKPRVTNKNSLSHLKNPVFLQHQSGAIYSISSSDLYIGESGRYITERVSEQRTHTVRENVSGSGLAEHVGDSVHAMDWNSCKIIHKKDHWKKRKHLESLSINGDKGTFPNIYLALLHSKKH